MKKRDRKCRRKIRHDTWEHAVIALKSLHKKNFFIHKRRIYHCKYCGGYHIGRVNEIHPHLAKEFQKLLNKA